MFFYVFSFIFITVLVFLVIHQTKIWNFALASNWNKKCKKYKLSNISALFNSINKNAFANVFWVFLAHYYTVRHFCNFYGYLLYIAHNTANSLYSK